MTRTINTISGGFASGGTLKSSRKRYAREFLNITSTPRKGKSILPVITFTEEDGEGIIPDHDDPLVITGIIVNAEVRQVFVDQGSSADIIFIEVFEQLDIPKSEIMPYNDTLVGFSGSRIQPIGYVDFT